MLKHPVCSINHPPTLHKFNASAWHSVKKPLNHHYHWTILEVCFHKNISHTIQTWTLKRIIHQTINILRSDLCWRVMRKVVLIIDNTCVSEEGREWCLVRETIMSPFLPSISSSTHLLLPVHCNYPPQFSVISHRECMNELIQHQVRVSGWWYDEAWHCCVSSAEPIIIMLPTFLVCKETNTRTQHQSVVHWHTNHQCLSYLLSAGQNILIIILSLQLSQMFSWELIPHNQDQCSEAEYLRYFDNSEFLCDSSHNCDSFDQFQIYTTQHERIQDCGAGKRRCWQVSPHCSVCPGNLRGEVRPHHRGQLQEAGGGGRAAVHAGDTRRRRHRAIHRHEGPLHEEWPGLCPRLQHHCTEHF